MPTKKTRKARPKTLGDVVADAPSEGVTARVVGDRIVAARKRRSMNQSDLARATGLSRTVVNGYEKGRHLPGARELARICDALRTPPNELLYGVADPFAGVGSDLKLDAGVSAALMIQLIEQNEREAVLTLLQALVEFRRGRQAKEILAELAPVLVKQVAGPPLERALKKMPVVPEFQAFIERHAGSENAAPGETPHKPRPRRPAKRSR